MQPLLRREVRLHPRGPSRGDATTDGNKSVANPSHENCHPVARHLPEAHRICTQHTSEAHIEAGLLLRWLRGRPLGAFCDLC